jgi:hypothetical protein
MSVGTFLQPDHETQSGSVYKAAIDNSLAVLARIGQMFAPHEQSTPNMTVRIDPGPVWVGGVLTEKAAQNSATIIAPVGNPRIDRVVIDGQTGVVSVITGTPAGSPTAPAITSGKLPVCQVLLQTTSTVITNDMITDERVSGAGSSEAFPVNGIYANQGGDPATELGYGVWSAMDERLGFVSVYPPAFDTNFVKATSADYSPAHQAANPANSLMGAESNGWGTVASNSQRFHIDLGSAKVVTRLYYENEHNTGAETGKGVKNFTLWGSNTPTAFAELTYGTDTNWTQLTTDITQFAQHVAADQSDPHFVKVTNSVAYRYYAIKIADNWGTSNMWARRFELQVGHYLWLRTS